MLGIIITLGTLFLGFSKLNIFYTSKLKNMTIEQRVKFARLELKKLATKLVVNLKVKIDLTYEDKDDFDRVDRKKGVVVVSNHTSNFDIPCLITGLPIDIGFVAKKEMETWPFFGTWMKSAACVFLDRKNPREGIKSMKVAVGIVKEGHPVVIFPQGTRKSTFGENEFKKGSFKLAIESGGVIIPVVIKNVTDIQQPNGAKVNLGKTVKIYICKSIKISELTQEEIKVLDKTVEAKIREKFNS